MLIIIVVFVRPASDPCPGDVDESARIKRDQWVLWIQQVGLHLGATFVLFKKERIGKGDV
jgi:hypothetical protein